MNEAAEDPVQVALIAIRAAVDRLIQDVRVPIDVDNEDLARARLVAQRRARANDIIVQGKLESLASFASQPDVPVPPQFIGAGQKTATEELQQLAASSCLLADRLEALHRPSIKALGQVGVTRSAWHSPNQLRQLAYLAAAASGAAVGDHEPGRLPMYKTVACARLARSIFQDITNQDPDVSGGSDGLQKFATACLKQLRVKGSIKAALAAAEKPLKPEGLK